MKALSLTQPWATLVAIGAKRIETRSWATDYRGPIAIHAAKGFPQWARETCREPVFERTLWDAGYRLFAQLPLGVVVATTNLDGCIQVRETHDPRALANFKDYAAEHEATFGDYSVGRWLWLLSNATPLAEPVPARGALGLWEWES